MAVYISRGNPECRLSLDKEEYAELDTEPETDEDADNTVQRSHTKI